MGHRSLTCGGEPKDFDENDCVISAAIRWEFALPLSTKRTTISATTLQQQWRGLQALGQDIAKTANTVAAKFMPQTAVSFA